MDTAIFLEACKTAGLKAHVRVELESMANALTDEYNRIAVRAAEKAANADAKVQAKAKSGGSK